MEHLSRQAPALWGILGNCATGYQADLKIRPSLALQRNLFTPYLSRKERFFLTLAGIFIILVTKAIADKTPYSDP
jgi:hypothetical protein